MTASTSRLALAAIALSLSILALGSGRSHAAIHACPADDGGTVFQDRPCDERGTATNARAAGSTARGSTAVDPSDVEPPVGLHPSWFEPPAGALSRVECDETACRCGPVRRSFDGGLALAVADALYLDGAWHRHATIGDSGREDGTDARARRDEAACDVLISQHVLGRHAEPVLRTLRRRAREAEERGFDDPRACEAGRATACEHLDALELYRRMVVDLGALRIPRDGVPEDPDRVPDAPAGSGPTDASGRPFGTFPTK